MTTVADTSKTYTLFYSWQSDMPDNQGRNLIRSALRDAASAIEAKLPGVQITLDEATRGETGSPDIPSTIFRKIESADVIISDISIINSSTTTGRKTPNPNVLVELGYAAALHGWARIIMVSNKEFGDIDSLPFDIRQKRITQFKCPLPTGDAKKDKDSASNALGALTRDLTLAIEEIVKTSPNRPVAVATDAVSLKRQRDIRTLNDLLLHLNPDVFDSLWEDAPHRINFTVFHFWEGFSALWEASSTYLYDETARNWMIQVHQYWGDVLSHGTHYQRGLGDFYIWHAPGDMFPSSTSEEDYKKTIEEMRSLKKVYSALMAHLRSNYIELDLETLRKNSWARYHEFHQEIKSLFPSASNKLSD
ncbi:hypothetical protein [Archangium violaceum]|uniref:hypothetical protein n=1 Tax=Archangium violaceum TaxID=83451 RepID=UPI00126988E0|nr:hypothetical protein [Archangium violaceum]